MSDLSTNTSTTSNPDVVVERLNYSSNILSSPSSARHKLTNPVWIRKLDDEEIPEAELEYRNYQPPEIDPDDFIIRLPDNTETFGQKLFRKFKQEPLVPIGCIATIAMLTGGLRTFKNGGSSVVQNRYMWGRVIAQGFTLAVLSYAALFQWPKQAKQKEKEAAQQALD